MRILYTQPSETTPYDEERFKASLARYGNYNLEALRKGIEQLNYDPLHVSRLVELGTQVIENEDSAKAYYDDHKDWFNSRNFERLRRITGYLVGSLERWNDGKRAEERERVKHSVGQYHSAGQYSLDEKDEIENKKSEEVIARQV